MADTAAEIQVKIDSVNAGIEKILILGQEYEIWTNGSKRVFKAANIKELRDYLNYLESRLDDLSGDSGILVGF